MSREDINRQFEALFHDVPPTPAKPAADLVAPTIDAQPEDRTVSVGKKAVFAVVVAGTGPFTFSWRKNGVVVRSTIGTGREAEFVEELPEPKDNGTVFDVVVENASGSVTSRGAVLTVTEDPDQTKRRVAGVSADFADCSVDEIVRIEQISKTLLNEARRVNAQRLKGTFDYKKQFRKIVDSSRFQRFAFDKNMRHSDQANSTSKAHLAGSGVNGEGDLLDPAAALFNGLSADTGVSVGTMPGDPAGLGVRQETPPWMLKPDDFLRFLYWHVATKTGEEPPADKEKLIQTAGLDYLILRDYYLRRCEDQTIFETYKARFCRERNRQRKTKSGDAVKMRRIRLVSDGNTLFGTKSKLSDEDQVSPDASFECSE